MNTVEPRLLVTIDTECDKSQNWRTASPLTFRGVTEAIPDRLQPLFARHGIRPTYLLSPEVMTHPESVATLREVREAELTTHLHGDYIVPRIKTWDLAGSITDEMQWEYGADLERAKMASLTEMFRQQFGRQPLSFRAGRFGAGPHTGKILQNLGYTIDSSVTPHICWTSRKGEKRPDYRGYSEMPYMLGSEGDIACPGVGGILELPVTILPIGAVATKRPSEPIWFRPWYSDTDTLCRVVDHVLAQPPINGVHRPLVMMFHNVELLAGASPYPQTAAEVQCYLDMMARVFERAAKRGVKSCTMAEYQAYYANQIPRAEIPKGKPASPITLRSSPLKPQLQLDAAMVEAILDRHGVQPWFKYIFGDRANRWDCWKPCFWLARNVPTTAPVLSLGTGAGFNLFWLAEQGFTHLHGTDIDPKAVAAGNELAALTGLPVELAVDDALHPKTFRQGKYAAIEALNWCHLLNNFSLDNLLDQYEPLLSEDGVFIIDAIDVAYDQLPDNQYCTQDQKKPIAERRPSEYRTRMSEEGVREAFTRHGLSIVGIIQETQIIPKRVYIGQRTAAAQAAGHGKAPVELQPETEPNTVEAEQTARQALAEDPQNLDALKLLLSACLDTARWVEGARICGRIREQTPDDIAVLQALAYCLQESGDPTGSAAISQRVKTLTTGNQPIDPPTVINATTPAKMTCAPESKRPRVLLIADVPNWIFERHARTLHALLQDDFDFTLTFQGQPFNEDDYDLIYPLEWNLVSPEQIRTPQKWITGIRSHCSWDKKVFADFVAHLRRDFQRVHVVSERLRGLFAPHLPGVVCLSHGVDTGHFTPTQRIKRSGQSLRLGWAGNRKSPNKGFKEIIEPLGQLPGVELVFCGYSDRNLTFAEMRDFYNSVDAYVCASDFEGNNNSLLEAAAMGCAIVTTDNGTVPEYLRHGESALIVERTLAAFQRAVESLRDNPTLCFELGAAARASVVAQWDWRTKAEDYRTLFWAALTAAGYQRTDQASPTNANTTAPTDRIQQSPPDEFSPEIAAELQQASAALERNDFPTAYAIYHRAFKAHSENDRLRELVALATSEARAACPVPDLNGQVKPARLNLAILTFNALEYTQLCLASLKRHTTEPYNVFIVDNGSTDGTREWFAQQTDANLFVEFSPVNLGVPGGRNRLLQLITSHLPEDGFVIFMDNDIEVMPGWVEHYLNFFAAYPHVGIATAVGHTFVVRDQHRELGPFPVGAPAPVDVACGGFGCWIRSATARAVGEYDEHLGLFWHEDDDYSVRALAAGWEVFSVPGAPVLHHEHRSGAARPNLKTGGSPSNQRYLVNKWRRFGWIDASGHPRRPAPQAPLTNVAVRRPIARVALPVRWAAPIFNPSGYASEAISFILPISQQLNLGITHDNELLSRKFFAELAAPERDRLLALIDKHQLMRGGIHISHNPAPGFRRTPDAVYHIGRTMYETDRIPSSWVGYCNTMDEVWVPSRFNVETFAACGVEREKLVIMPGAVDETLFDPAKHQPLPLHQPAKFNFVSVFEWSGRKAWDVLLAAYLREFSAEDDVCLYLRTYLFSRPEADPSDVLKPLIEAFTANLGLGKKPLPRIELLPQQIPTQDLPRLYLAADCLVVPSRGEGWGRPMHEAMAMGRPVIATNWSANTEFMNEENSYLVDCELVDVQNVEPYLRHYHGHRWANPSEKHLREIMRRVHQHPEEALAKGAKARAHVTKYFSRAAVGELVMQRLEAIERKFTTPACPAVTARATAAPAVEAPEPVDASGAPVVVAWEGSFLDHGSLSHVNRELTSAIENVPGIRLTRVAPAGPKAPANLRHVARTLKAVAPSNTQVTVRHSWPPVWEAPKSGKWVQIQPWEFGALPKAWARHATGADQIWTYSEYVRRLYVATGLDPHRVKIVPLGIDPQRFEPGAKPLALATQKKFKFLFVGGTIHRKGPDVLLAAYQKTFTAADDVCLVIKDFGGKSVYAGQTLEAQIKSIQENPDAPEILYLNEELPPEALPSLYTACNCLVHPYRGEGFGLPVLEAMACALPVIVTAGGSTDDFATDEFAFRVPSVRHPIANRIGDLELVTRGWLLEPDTDAVAQRMRWVVENRSEAHTKGQAASEHVRREWTWAKAATLAEKYLCELAALGDADAAAAARSTAVRKPDPTTTAVALLGNLIRAEQLLREKSLRTAWEATCMAIQERPFHPEAFLLLAEIARMAGDAASARRCAQHARQLVPSFKPAKKFLKLDLKGNTKHDWLTLPDALQPSSAPSKPRLSVCLIVKNEEQFLGQCLGSIKGLADQIIVVDTGSTDRTVEIARQHGAEVHAFTWCDDFSAARNAALEHATGDWVLVLDADEEIPAANHAALKAHLREAAVMAWRLPIVDAGKEGAGRSYVPRLFRNAPGVFFAGRVHEHPFGVIEQLRKTWGLDNRLGEAVIVHHGYTQAVTQDRDKVARNLRLLELALKDSPGNTLLLMNLGLELCRSKRLDEGIYRYGEAYTALSREPVSVVVPEFRETLLTQFASYLFAAKRSPEVIQLLTSPLARQTELTASQHYVLGMAQIEQQKYAEAAAHLRQCLARRNTPSLTPAIPEIQKSAPRRALALCLSRLKETTAAGKEFALALEEDPQSAALQVDYAKFLNETGQLADALQLLHKFVSQTPDQSAVWTCGGQIALSQPDLLDVALDWTAVAVQHLPNEEEIVTLRAEALLLAGQFTEALPLWKKLEPTAHARVFAAIILCESGLTTTRTTPPAHLIGAVDQEFARWFQRLVEFKAEATIVQLLGQADAVATLLPTAGGILKEIAKELATSATKPTTVG